MPWVDEKKCTGCGVCVEKCPVGSIAFSVRQEEAKKAKINMDTCIRCGTCHSVCPTEAVRHDGEKIPEWIKANVEMTKKNMELCAQYLGREDEKRKCLDRMRKHFNKEKVIAEKTLDELDKL